MELPSRFFKQRKLQTHVEQRSAYTLEHSELNVFETHQKAEAVKLQFGTPVLASMLVGRKVMHLRDHRGFDFLPGESILLPPDEIMCIDFPDATEQHPTRCLALCIDEDKIEQLLQQLNEFHPRQDGASWELHPDNMHFRNEPVIHQLLQRLIFVFTEDHPQKEIFVDGMLRELLIRICQTKNVEELRQAPSSSHRLAFVLDYIHKNLHKPLSVAELSHKAHISESHFHRVFKQEMGSSPVDYINGQRLRLASQLLRSSAMSVGEICQRCGFSSLSYFTRLFKRNKSITPKQFQQQWRS